MSAIPQNSINWQVGFLEVLPAVTNHARIQFRFLPLEEREEMVQESIASACVAYQRLAAQGKLYQACPSSLATFAVRQARAGRHVGGHQNAALDVMSPVCQQRRGFSVQSYNGNRSAKSGAVLACWNEMTIAMRNESVPGAVAFRIDFAHWLKTLTQRDRRIIRAMIRRESGWAIANRFGITQARVSQLRRKFEREWGLFQRQERRLAA